MNPVAESLKRAGACLRAPASEDTVRAIEARYGLSIPSGARELYLEANGADGEFGNWSWNFWPIDSEKLRLSDYFRSPRSYEVAGRKINPSKYLRFFDVLIDAPLYAYCADAGLAHFGEVLAIYSDDGTFDAEVCAHSVTAFLEVVVGSGLEDALVFE